MSRERARRRAEREAAAAALAAARAAEVERRAQRDARVAALTGWVPRPRRRPSGVIAQRRQRESGLLVVAVVALNILVWLASTDWAVRLLALVLSVLIAPLVQILLSRK